ncbi:MAG: hypothetical protein JWO67_6947 [Streptosporangiaceae bacterium]|nr:hypothetical protein [Streptosporangiaceae bacterium]
MAEFSAAKCDADAAAADEDDEVEAAGPQPVRMNAPSAPTGRSSDRPRRFFLDFCGGASEVPIMSPPFALDTGSALRFGSVGLSN